MEEINKEIQIKTSDIVPAKLNFEEIKTKLTEMSEYYKNLLYTDDDILVAKKDRAYLNKIKTALNSKKIEVKKTIFNDFENKVKELVEIVGGASSVIDTKVSEYEEKVKREKSKEIRKIFVEQINGSDLEDIVIFDKIFDERWLNATEKLSKVSAKIELILTNTKSGLQTIEGLKMDKDIKASVLATFKDSLDINVAMDKKIKLEKEAEENKKQLEEYEKKRNIKSEEPAPTPAPIAEPEKSEKSEPVEAKTGEIVVPEKETISISFKLSATEKKDVFDFLNEQGIDYDVIF